MKSKSFSERKKALRPQAIQISAQEMVEIRPLADGEDLPLLVTPNYPQVNLCEWYESRREQVEGWLLKHGGILFRGFDVRSQEDFQEFVKRSCREVMDYKEGATPRTKLSHSVYTSTEFPKEERIALHNELSYVPTWPSKIIFYSEVPAETGGETIIADVRRVYERIDPVVREKFERKGWLLVRNYGSGFGLPWQDVFHASTQEEVEEYCRRNGMACEWREDGQLRTRQVRPAVAHHPATGEKLWFNHCAFWHESSLNPQVREILRRDFGEDGMPYNTFFGDGEPLTWEEAEALRSAYDEATVAFPWQAGDVLLLDNMLVAHGRNPFTGPRKVLVAMGEPCSREQAGGMKDVD